MKNLYFVFLFTFISPLFTNSALAQCDDISLENLTNPGPFDVEILTEADGIRNGPNYLEATIYYPTNATPPYASIAIVPWICIVFLRVLKSGDHFMRLTES